MLERCVNTNLMEKMMEGLIEKTKVMKGNGKEKNYKSL